MICGTRMYVITEISGRRGGVHSDESDESEEQDGRSRGDKLPLRGGAE